MSFFLFISMGIFFIASTHSLRYFSPSVFLLSLSIIGKRAYRVHLF
ncbi:MAG TPA: hypothetical protein GX516_08440 [Thermoanaerobacter sp.]|nr:hypothetical protein [Thermoanaerobacter sp.]